MEKNHLNPRSKMMIMMLNSGKKEALPGNETEDAEEGNDLDQEGKHAAMKDFLGAVDAGDHAAASEAMENWMDHHQGSHVDEEDTDRLKPHKGVTHKEV
jgi:hypothetical protein